MYKTLLKFAISLAALAFAFYKLELAAAIGIAAGADWLLLALALCVTAVSVTLLGVRWRLLLAPISHPSLSSAVIGQYIGLFGNNVFPLRLGELIRARYMSAHSDAGLLKVLATIFLERLFDLFIVAAVAGLLVLGGTFASPLFGDAGLVLAGALALLTAPLAMWAFRPLAVTLLIRKFGQTAESTRWITGLLNARTIVLALAVSACIWGAYGFRYQIVLLAIGLPVDFELLALLIVATVIGFMIPAAPGAIGTYHLAVVFSMHNVYEIPLAQAQVASVLLHLSSYIPATLIGFVFFLRTRIGAHAPDAPAQPERAAAERLLPSGDYR